ncbi:MAG: 30S ribosome-binding factor RbfA [Nisaea sp.]|uniref:30S ribosome-binding factor RbfA n=1 Tax=Nisaea sp. TaxID=2024842 RepID=UPI001B2D9E03|nr:30S ribosome-binding factor RbfA [Nisaea sp.]MBO6560524.1 30S ribosome-binding factor RbfA [Nisaea sp.]
MVGSHPEKAGRRGRAPSQRQLRVGEEVRHVLAGVFQRGELHDPELDGVSITVSEVSVSPDLRNATVFVMPLGGAHADDVLAGLKRAAPFLRTMLAKQMTLRTVPRMRFIIDTAFETASRINEMFQDPVVRADLEKHDDEEEGGNGA